MNRAMRRRFLRLGGFAGAVGLWLLFVDKLATHEWLAGLGAAALALTASEVARAEEDPRFAPHARWFLELWRIPMDIVSGTGTLIRCLFTRCPGLMRQTRFNVGGNDRQSTARRALAIAFGSIAPNSIIIGIDRKSGLMLVHVADHVPLPKIARRFGALP